ncbi:uncharacterized protein LOC135399214 [Ornithodoros turicata]|uniref:uncharacterized protein LOC135399214 n=1 Tax=Ornithodoros turicata TaxID=34597 RepID=UPI003138AF05
MEKEETRSETCKTKGHSKARGSTAEKKDLLTEATSKQLASYSPTDSLPVGSQTDTQLHFKEADHSTLTKPTSAVSEPSRTSIPSSSTSRQPFALPTGNVEEPDSKQLPVDGADGLPVPSLSAIDEGRATVEHTGSPCAEKSPNLEQQRRRKSSVRFGPSTIRELTELTISKIEQKLTTHPVIIVMSFIITITILMLLFLMFQMQFSTPGSRPCESVACHNAVNFLDSVSNPDVRPCDDFYSNVCHKWIANDSSFLVDIVDDFYNGSHSTMMMKGSELPDRYGTHIFKSSYRLCHGFMTKGRNSIEDILNHMNFESHGPSDKPKIVLWLAELSLKKGLDSVFRLRVVRWRESGVYLYVTPGKSLGQRLGEETREGNFQLYLSEVIDSLNLTSASNELVNGIVELDARIEDLTAGDEDEQPVRHQVGDLARLSERLSTQDWLTTVNAILAGGISGLNVGSDFLAWNFNATVKAVDAVLSSMEQVRNNYIYLLVAAELLRFDYARRFKHYTGVPTFCFGASMRLLTHTWSFLVSRTRDQTRRDEELVRLYDGIFDVITKSKYNALMDNTTRDHTVTLLKEVAIVKFSTEEFTLDISADYSGVGAPTDFLGSYLPLLEHGTRLHLQVPLSYDAETLNEIQYLGVLRQLKSSGLVVVPTASKTVPLFYSGQVPSYFNFGTVGYLLAKELSRMIRPFLARDRPNPMWTPSGISAVEPALQCLKGIATNISGTTGFGGYESLFEWSRSVQIAYDAMEKEIKTSIRGTVNDHKYRMESRRVFFRRFCLTSCGKGPARCILPLRNMPQFAYAFGCSNNDRMVAERRCDII